MTECKKDMLCVEIFRLFLHVIYVKLITSRKSKSYFMWDGLPSHFLFIIGNSEQLL